MLRVPYIKSDQIAVEPRRAHATDAGYDLVAIEKVEICPQERALVDTGLAIEIPAGYAGLILPRSGLALKKGLTVLNAPGLIDSGYRGNVRVLLYNSGPTGSVQEVCAGDRIAQLVIVKVEDVHFGHTAWLHPSDREQGGFGSTGEAA